MVLADALTESQTRLLNDVKYLASDDLQGRGVDTEGINKAADFIRDEFQKAGLNVTEVKGGAYQPFPLVTGTKLGKDNSLTLVAPGGEEISLKPNDQFNTCSFGGSGKFDGEVVFLGYAIDTEEYSDIPKDLDLKGKIVVVMRRNPQQANPHGPFAGAHGSVSRHAALTSKISHGFRKGAAAVLFVNDTYTARHTEDELKRKSKRPRSNSPRSPSNSQRATPRKRNSTAAVSKKHEDAKRYLQTLEDRAKNADPDELMAFGYGGDGRKNSIPVFHIKQEMADRMLKDAAVAVARAAGLHTSRLDGAPLEYNRPDPLLPDLIVCRPELAEAVLAATR